jgi:F1F0 ATPase subunit 2
MRINEVLSITPEGAAMLILSALVGVILSVIYFGGLWYTVQNLDRVKQPALLFTGSFLIRMVVVLAGFYLVSDGRIERLAVCLISFFITRQVFLKWAQGTKKTGLSEP